METQRQNLGMLAPGKSGVVYAVDTKDGRIRRKIVDMGITPGTEITIIKVAPMGDPIEIELRGYSLSLRKEDASRITLMQIGELEVLRNGLKRAQKEAERRSKAKLPHESNTDEAGHIQAAKVTEFVLKGGDSCMNCPDRQCDHNCRACFRADGQPVKLALVGNPNCGKTTLFNALTGGHEYVGNWPGVTVEKKEGKIKSQGGFCTHGHEMTLVDLPGIYSLSPHTMEEVIARRFIVDEKPDAVINIVDATNLERNLYLTIQLMELERPMIVALNMMDEVEKNGDKIDVRRLSLELGIPVVPISARTGMGVEDLIREAQKLIHAVHDQIDQGFCIEPDDLYDPFTHLIHHEIGALAEPYAKSAGLPLHWTEIKLLEGDALILESLSLPEDVKKKIDLLIKEYAAVSPLGDNETLVADSRYRYVEKVCSLALKRARRQGEESLSNRIDRVLTHKIFALPVFFGIMALIFGLTFGSLGAWLSDLVALLIDDGLAPFVQKALMSLGAMDWFVSLVCNGIIKGVGGVLTFLPQIAILFFCLSALEDSGYMSRIAFIMDKLMRRFGLSGRSFIPLLMGFGCTVPAAMGARTMEDEKDKRMTILLLPFMSCSAKLPVYGLIAGAFFAKGRWLVIFSLYLLGILMGILSGLIFKKTIFTGPDAPLSLSCRPTGCPLREIPLPMYGKG